MATVIRKIQGGGLTFHCPACQNAHSLNCSGDPKWDYNGNAEKPTFSPSILVWWSDSKGPKRCHSYVRDGLIRFLPDCTHSLAGKTVPLPPWPHAPGTYSGLDESP